MRMKQDKKSDNRKSSYEPVKKSQGKEKEVNSNKNKTSKGHSNKGVPASPTTEVNPEG
jgi:hypothetical protein